MLCQNCGKEIPDGSKFCPYCGANQFEVLLKKQSAGVGDENRFYREESGGGYFSFRTMVTPIIVKWVYAIGMIAITIGGIVTMFRRNDYYESGGGFWMGLGIIVVGNLLWRVACEGIILIFSIHDILASIERKIKH
ncbi:DUF4282 domain-containing protein [Caldisericum sp.]|uniref:DUF4282 domain-containing protein n=1 Tax=Caldisericum sp. TaxID=2499687 RepID=UPI003D0EDC43